MKLRIALCIVIGLGICTTARANGFAMTVKPAIIGPGIIAPITITPYYGGVSLPVSIVTSAAQFGYRASNFMVGVGLEYGGYSIEDRVIHTDTSGHEDSSSVEDALRYSVFLPEVAARYYFAGGEVSDQGGEISPYVGVSAFYSIGSPDYVTSGIRDTATIRQIDKDLTGNLGGTLSVGVEYAFNRNFSIGGEFGLQLVSTRLTDYPDPGMTLNQLRAETQASLCLNYYFQ